MVFWITFVVYIVTTAFYAIMCSGDLQPWADPVSEEEESESDLQRSESVESSSQQQQQPLTRSKSTNQSKSSSKRASLSSQGSKTR